MGDQENPDDGIVHYEGGVPIFNARLNTLEHEAREAKRRDEDYKNTQNELNRLLVWFTGVLAIVGVVGSAVSAYQVHVAKISASAAQANADAAKANANAAQSMVGEMGKQYPELQASAEAARDAANINRQALYSVQRAYVIFPDKPEIDYFVDKHFFVFEMPLENTGATPAHGLKDRVSCETRMGPLPESFTFPDKQGVCGNPWAATGANVIAAKGKIYSQQVFMEDSIIKEFLQQNNGPWPGTPGQPFRPNHPTRTIFFYGWVAYHDIFKDSPEHLSEFCRQLQILVMQGQNSQAQWGYCPTHNCTDEDCPDYKERIQAAHSAPTCCPHKWFKKTEPK